MDEMVTYDAETGKRTSVPLTPAEQADREQRAADAAALQPTEDPVAVAQRQIDTLLAALAKAQTLAAVRTAAQQADAAG
jgi:hypothetical protein